MHAQTMELKLGGIELLLSAMKCVFMPQANTLLLADLHLGKAAHFRKNALPLPQQAHIRDYENLQRALDVFQPERVIFLGDLFHSSYNKAWEEAALFFQSYPNVRWQLVMGNHDILHRSHYEAAHIECIEEGNSLQGLILFHHPPEHAGNHTAPHVCGHIHPGISLSSKSRDRIVLPCFYLKGTQLILPAFGALTGLARCKKEQEQERLIGISGSSLLEL